MTYQAASGQGAAAMRDLVAQMAAIGSRVMPLLDDPASAILEIDRVVTEFDPLARAAQGRDRLSARRQPPAVDRQGPRQRPEPGGVEGAGRSEQDSWPQRQRIPMDGVCVRIGAMRCHSQAMTVKLRHAVPMDEIEGMLAEAHDWVKVVPNRREDSLAELTPAAVTGKLTVPVGRLRRNAHGRALFGSFSVGDQLLWRRGPCAAWSASFWTPG